VTYWCNQYVTDCQVGVNRWNKILDDAGLPQRLALPHAGFNRHVGAFAGAHISPSGEVLPEREWQARSRHWLPTDVDKTHVRSLMRPVYERGKIASWLAPPRNGINGKPFDYEYVHLP
jgi:benzoyl-CoA 2,3-epoxidase subunit B